MEEQPPSLPDSNSLEPTLDQVLAPSNVASAWKRVRSNHGAPGLDGVTVDQVETEFATLWQPIEEAIRAGSYAPAGFREVPIPKPGGGERRLRIPTVIDRVVLQATAQVLEPVWEPVFCQRSYGYRKGRGPVDGVLAAAAELDAGHIWAADVDIRSFFDEVDLEKLCELLREGLQDQALLGHVLRCVRAGGISKQATVAAKGLPQGSPLSPLLANIILHEFDRNATQRGWAFVRYADDVVVFCDSQEEARSILVDVGEFLDRHLCLQLHPEKSEVVAAPEVRFLGFAFRRMADGRFRPCLSPEAREAFRSKIIELTEYHPGLTFDQAARQAGAFFRHWIAYFAYGGARALIPRESLSGFVRTRLRGLQWLEWGTDDRRIQEIVSRGVPEELARRDTRRKLPTEEAARCAALSAALPNHIFAPYGLAESVADRTRPATSAKSTAPSSSRTDPASHPPHDPPGAAGAPYSDLPTTWQVGGHSLEVILQPNGWLTLRLQTARQ